jgi:Glycosyl hydrolase family 65 central catalytic domain
MAYQGAIFDVDGVLVDSPHQLAWREALKELLEGDWRDIGDQTSWTAERPTTQVYQQVIAGKPRLAGARAALEHFGVLVLQRALEALQELAPHYRRELVEELSIGDEELDLWREISRKMTVVFHADGVLSQFEGYEQLLVFDWEGYRDKYGNIQRLDRVLEAEGDSTNRYKVSKQADVLMLFYLLAHDELRALLRSAREITGDDVE